MRSVTPLPATLSGNTIQRLIEIDEALIPYVNGALVWLCDKEPFQETGTLTVDDAKLLFSDMLQIYFTESPAMIPIGTINMFATDTQPDKWLVCDGAAYSRTVYADLFAVIGTAYGAGNGTTTFNIPDWRDLSPMGSGGSVVGLPGAVQGALTVTLDIDEIPPHDHGFNDPGHAHRVQKASATVNAGVNTSTPNARTDNPATPHMMTDAASTGIDVGVEGDGQPHNNLHPVMGTNFIIYAGV